MIFKEIDNMKDVGAITTISYPIILICYLTISQTKILWHLILQVSLRSGICR